jgi:hypothetical protein
MIQNLKYITQVFRKDKIIKISTISPNGKFIYKIKEPKDLYWGLFCCPIAFFDVDGNLIYYNKSQYAQIGIKKNNDWDLVSWSSSGNIVFFIERNSKKSFQYILLNLKYKTVSKKYSDDTDNEKLYNELLRKLSPDKAMESYYEIITAESYEKAIENVLAITQIEEKRELIRVIEQYYFSDIKKLLAHFEKGDFDEKIILGTTFDNFKPIIIDPLKKGLLEKLGINKWRP